MPASFVPEEMSNAEQKICWGAKVSKDFKAKVIEICKNLGVAPDYLMACMAFESGETFSPSIQNAAGSGKANEVLFKLSREKDGSILTEWRALQPKSGIKATGKYFEKE
jgi:hypothetical protein